MVKLAGYFLPFHTDIFRWTPLVRAHAMHSLYSERGMRERPGATTWADMCGGGGVTMPGTAHAPRACSLILTATAISRSFLTCDRRKDTKEDDVPNVIRVEGSEAENLTQT